MSLKSKFCAKCGATSEKLTNNLCPECFLSIKSFRVPAKKHIRVCSKCGSVLFNHFWVSGYSPKEALREQIQHKIVIPEAVEVVKIDLLKIRANGSIEVTYNINGGIVSEESTCNLKIKKELCPICRKKLIRKYKAKLQLRSGKKVKYFIRNSINFLQKYRSSIIRIKWLRTGIDVHLRSRKQALKIAHEFKKKFNCSMKETREEYGWNKSKNRPKYKSTFLLKK